MTNNNNFIVIIIKFIFLLFSIFYPLKL